MNSEEFKTILYVISVAAQLGVVPLLGVLWKLNNALNELKSTMHEKFLSKDEFHEWRNEWRQEKDRAA